MTSVESNLRSRGIYIKDLGNDVTVQLCTRASIQNEANWKHACMVNDWTHTPCPQPPKLDDSTEYIENVSFKKGDLRLNMKTRARAFHISINNPTEETMRYVQRTVDQCIYARVGYEVGKNQGTPHLQGVLYFENPRVNHQVFSMIGGVGYCKVCYSSISKNVKYIAKDECTMFAIGAHPPSQGKRSDLSDIYDKLREGWTQREIMDLDPNPQQIYVMEKWLKINEKGKSWKPEVRWYYGESGCGKSVAARKWLDGDRWERLRDKGGSQGWIDRYDRHADVLLDELRPDTYDPQQLLGMIGDGECCMPTKGSFRQFVPRRIAITTIYTPEQFWALCVAETKIKAGSADEFYQLERRIDAAVYVPPFLSKQNRYRCPYLTLKRADAQDPDCLVASSTHDPTNVSEASSEEMCYCHQPVSACVCEDIEHYWYNDEPENYISEEESKEIVKMPEFSRPAFTVPKTIRHVPARQTFFEPGIRESPPEAFNFVTRSSYLHKTHKRLSDKLRWRSQQSVNTNVV